MSVTLLHIFHDDNDPGAISAEVKIPVNNPIYCITILQTMDKVKNTIVKQLADQNNQKMSAKKGVMELARNLFKGKLAKEEEAKMNEDIKKMSDAEEIGKGIQSTLQHLQVVLNKADPEERNRLIKDINSTIQNITRGG